MHILNKLTINNLKLNKKRSIVTIIGILLSTALICAIAGMFSTLQNSLITISARNTGYYHVAYLNLDKETLKYIENNRAVRYYYETSTLGYAKIETSNEYKPYLYIQEYSKNALTAGGVHLVDGRLPENSNEIVLP